MPMQPPENDQTLGQMPSPDTLSITPSSILVVDDESAIAASMVHFLRPHRVEYTSSAKLALQRIQIQNFDVILCDLLMPEMSGIDLFRSVAKQWPHLGQRFVFMTGGATTREAIYFLEHAENIRVAKPFSRNEIMFAIETQLRHS